MSALAATLQNGAVTFWRWWRDELVQLLPAAARARLQHRQLLPVIAYGDTAWTLWTPSLEQGRAVRRLQQTLDMSGDPETRQSLARTALERLQSPVALALPPAVVLRRRLTLPAALEENLKQALAYDLDRHTPFRADELYFDAQVVGRDNVRGEIHVDLAAVRRDVADPALNQLRELGAEVVAMLADAPANVDSRLNLLPAPIRARWLSWQPWAIGGGAALILLLLLLVIVFPVWQKRDYVKKLNTRTAAVYTEAMAVDRLHNELDQRVADYDFALERKETYPSTVQILDEITRLLPDDTWLTQMEVKTSPGNKETRREVFLRGESAHATQLVTRLEESGLVAQAAPRSSITTIRPGEGEMFDIGAQIKKLPLPERVAVLTPPVPVVPVVNAVMPAKNEAVAPATEPVQQPSSPPPGTMAGKQAPPSATVVPPASQPATTGEPQQPAKAVPPPPQGEVKAAPPAPTTALPTSPPVQPSSVVTPAPTVHGDTATQSAGHIVGGDGQVMRPAVEGVQQ